MSAVEEASSSAPASGGDPLTGNGLGSPLCSDARVADLAGATARNCGSSGFEASAAPTGNYAFDVHIDTGITKLGNDVSVSVQNGLQFGWMALVTLVHGLIVMLDWCFTLDLLNGPAMSGLARGLRETQATFTQPWLVLVLAIAAVLTAYHGLIRRRVAETVGEALLTLAMIAGGLWAIANPAGTVGALAGWASEASLGTLAAVATGSPAHSARTLGESTQELFRFAVYEPWCYMEFGDAGWCGGSTRVDPRLRAAALAMVSRDGADARESALLLRSARTNGEIFLAFPANGLPRNSITTEGSLFNVLCGGSAEPCRGVTANEAEFRTQSGTVGRFVGLLLIWVGALGMLLVLGFIVLRLLGAALMSLVYLLLAPVAVLAPALGEGGRGAFRGWVVRLLGAVASKLVYSFLLGAVLSAQRLLASVSLLGWWTRWLLVSALWWGAYRHRHKALDFSRGERHVPRRSLARRAREALATPRAVLRGADPVREKLKRPAPDPPQRERIARAGKELARRRADDQAKRSLEHEREHARATLSQGALRQERLTGMRAQLARVQEARRSARAGGDTLGTARLRAREQRIEGALAGEERELAKARRTLVESDRGRRRGGRDDTGERLAARGRWLDEQAGLPARGRLDTQGGRRDYGALAGLAGHTRGEYERLDPRARREARVQIDRELALRRELGGAVADMATAAGGEPRNGKPRNGERRRAGRELERALDRRLEKTGGTQPTDGDVAIDAWKRAGSSRRRTGSGSAVLDDAFAVEQGRKRQLGFDRP